MSIISTSRNVGTVPVVFCKARGVVEVAAHHIVLQQIIFTNTRTKSDTKMDTKMDSALFVDSDPITWPLELKWAVKYMSVSNTNLRKGVPDTPILLPGRRKSRNNGNDSYLPLKHNITKSTRMGVEGVFFLSLWVSNRVSLQYSCYAAITSTTKTTITITTNMKTTTVLPLPHHPEVLRLEKAGQSSVILCFLAEGQRSCYTFTIVRWCFWPLSFLLTMTMTTTRRWMFVFLLYCVAVAFAITVEEACTISLLRSGRQTQYRRIYTAEETARIGRMILW